MANKLTAAIFTHCGRQIVTGDEEEIARRVGLWRNEHNLDVSIAHDELVVEVPQRAVKGPPAGAR